MFSSWTRSLLSYSQFAEAHRFPAFDGIRAIAALLVVVFHFAGPHGQFLSGWLGVHLFFVLSGFLITTLLLREERAAGQVSLANFWIRRVLRIVPAYWAVLGATLAILLLSGEVTAAGVRQSLGWFATLNPDLAPTGMDFSQAWTIGIEQKFYLVWPLVAFVAVLASARRRALVWVVCLVVLGGLTVAVSSYFVHFGVILFGCGLALALDSPGAFRIVRFLTTPLAGTLALLALVALLLTAPALTAAAHSQVPTIVLFGLSAAAAIPALCARSLPSRVLGSSPLRWIGDRSYAIYLTQVIGGEIVHALFPRAPVLVAFPVIVIVILMMSDVLHRWVELPGITLGRRWVRARASRRGAVLTALPPGQV
jgi:peptidoglycan/LPS O-acetylase OafA/YrhL